MHFFKEDEKDTNFIKKNSKLKREFFTQNILKSSFAWLGPILILAFEF